VTRKQLLEDAIERIARWRGIEDTSVFTIIPVSRDCAGVVIMSTQWPEGGRLYRELKAVVRGFPEVVDATCVALLPEVVEELIATSRAASADGQATQDPRTETRAATPNKVARLARGGAQQAALLARHPEGSDAQPGAQAGEACG
jgi:hypothetical protein